MKHRYLLHDKIFMKFRGVRARKEIGILKKNRIEKRLHLRVNFQVINNNCFLKLSNNNKRSTKSLRDYVIIFYFVLSFLFKIIFLTKFYFFVRY